MLTFNLKTTFFTVKTSNEVYCCRIYFVNYIQNVHIINRTLHGSLEDMDFMFSWQEQYLTRSLRSLVRYCSCHSRYCSCRVISYIYPVAEIPGQSVYTVKYSSQLGEIRPLSARNTPIRVLLKKICYYAHI